VYGEALLRPTRTPGQGWPGRVPNKRIGRAKDGRAIESDKGVAKHCFATHELAVAKKRIVALRYRI